MSIEQQTLAALRAIVREQAVTNDLLRAIAAGAPPPKTAPASGEIDTPAPRKRAAARKR